ncbi:MAG: hypothetical protein JSV91_05680 [Phycisphaerales bacterium]|nr:MAG: hypothetical protein JSV91_05680 [Phycisphaerales bacterium]
MELTAEEPKPAASSGSGLGASMSRTDWTLVLEAARGQDQKVALERLSRRYWPAIYAFIRATGRNTHEAADLCQGFVCDVMLGRNIFQTADPKRGRFRSLLLTALKNYLRQRHRHDTAKKRAPGGTPPPLVDVQILETAAVDPNQTPEQAFAAQWSAALIRQVLGRVKACCLNDGLEPHWVVFECRVVKPMLFGDRPTAYSELVDSLKLEDAAQAANMMVTAKRRFAHELLAEVAGTLVNPAYSEDELSTLLHDLERSA